MLDATRWASGRHRTNVGWEAIRMVNIILFRMAPIILNVNSDSRKINLWAAPRQTRRPVTSGS
jgi:hypothetical protein